MSKPIKRYFNAFFTLSKTEQKGIFILSILILAVILFNQLIPLLFHHKKVDQSEFIAEIESFKKAQKHISDSIQLERLQNRGELNLVQAHKKLKPFEFDPNHLPKADWLSLGLTKKQVSVIRNYQAKGGKFKVKEDLNKMYCISSAEYEVLEPFIKIANSYPSQARRKEPFTKNKTQIPINKDGRRIDINIADSAALTDDLYLPGWLAQRILKYRTLLGGFYTKTQLFEVYGMDSLQLLKKIDFIHIDTTKIDKLNINTSTFKVLLKHPYITYETTTSIVNRRLEKGMFKSVSQLQKEGLVSSQLYKQLKHYLAVE